MSKMRMSIVTVKKCVFCKYWRGNAAVPTRIKNYWEFESDDRGECLKLKKERASHTTACSAYVLDNYKYPEM